MKERWRASDDPVARMLRKAFADECPPRGLEDRLAQSLRMLPSGARTIPVSRRVAMIAAAFLIFVFAVILLRPERAELADVPLKELQAFIDSNRPVDVPTNDPVGVRNWLARRVDFTPPSMTKGSRDIELIGGRLCLFAGRRVASYMYRVHGRLVSIYIMTAAGLSPRGGIDIERVGRTVAVMREGRLAQASWMKDGLIYSVVGELSQTGLLAALDEMHL
jgi:anti-sigma factor RsiW